MARSSIRILVLALLAAGWVAACSSDSDSSNPLPQQSSAICGTELSTGDASSDECITNACCESFDACKADEACAPCLAGGDGCEGNDLSNAFWGCVDANQCMGGETPDGGAGAAGSAGNGGEGGGKGGAAGEGGGGTGGKGGSGGSGGKGGSGGTGGASGGSSGAGGATDGSGGGPVCGAELPWLGGDAACRPCLETSCCAELEACNANNHCFECFAFPLETDCTDTSKPPALALRQCAIAHCNSKCPYLPLIPQCSAPTTSPSGGSCVTMGSGVVCNAITGEGCDDASDVCGISGGSFKCIYGGTKAGLCDECDTSLGPTCESGYYCVRAAISYTTMGTYRCARTCCDDGDCPGARCDKSFNLDQGVGVCLE